MIFYYIRHGDPIYQPDDLTELGKKQAEAVAKRLAVYGVDRVFASTSNRAVQTAKPTCELTKNTLELLDFANEAHAWNEFSVGKGDNAKWCFQDYETKMFFDDECVAKLGQNWYDYPKLSRYKKGMERVSEDTYEFFKMLGYERVGNTGKYRVLNLGNERVALFAHGGFGIAFLSAVLGIPYPFCANHFDICHSGITAINFAEENGFAFAKMMTLSSDAHLYKEGLPTKYNNCVYL